MLCYEYFIVIYDDVCVENMLNILCGDLFLTLMKTWIISCQQVVEAHEDGYKDLMEEDGTYDTSGVLIDGGKWYLQCVWCVVGPFVVGFLEVEVV